ncbi:hypothetical protein PoB_006852800 [Plakobranchus ocellatus]|uniref:Uncharacterized protein n=1 Tax=Plakobranchus ocellatus TaxID=259542 RepID=A0AAV4DD90_9GAST|nr:hypothetical protein PoB_006852800 [Plakobranchus ocellatus]
MPLVAIGLEVLSFALKNATQGAFELRQLKSSTPIGPSRDFGVVAQQIAILPCKLQGPFCLGFELRH